MNNDLDFGVNDDLATDPVDYEESTPEQTNEPDDLVQQRRKALQKGEEELKREDFPNLEEYQRYSQTISSQLEVVQSVGGSEAFQERQKRQILKTLHSSGSPFAKYLPGRKTRRKSSGSGKFTPKIPELAKFNKLRQAAQERFVKESKDWEELQAINSYLEELGIDNEATITKINSKGEEVTVPVVIPEPTMYFAHKNPVSAWIKQNYGK